jgi:hypothetical protein
MKTNKIVLLLSLLFGISLIAPAFAQSSILNAVSSQLCAVVNFVRAIVGVFALMLFLLGGVLYAVGHFLPAAGNIRQNMQGWAMGMIFAAVVALVIFILAEPLIKLISGFGTAAGQSSLIFTC